MVQSPLGRREPTWIDPAWSAVNVASHLRTWDAVVPLAKVYSVVMVSASCTWSAVTGVGSTKSIVPLRLAVYDPRLDVQPAKSTRTESGTGSPSEFTGGDGLRVGVQGADDVGMEGAPINGSTANGTPVAASNVAPCDSAAASVATTSAMAFASGWVRTGLGDVVGESGEHAVNNATVMVPAARRQ